MALRTALLLLAASAVCAKKKDDGKVDPEHLLPIDYLKVEDVHQWLTEQKDAGKLHDDIDPDKFKENSVQGTTLKWLGAMGRGDKAKEELLEKVGCTSRACYKKFSQAVTAMYIEQRNAKWHPGAAKKGDAGESEEVVTVTPDQVKKMKVTDLQRFLKSHGINPAAVGSEKRDLRRRALEILGGEGSGAAAASEGKPKQEKKAEPKQEKKAETKEAKKAEKKKEKQEAGKPKQEKKAEKEPAKKAEKPKEAAKKAEKKKAEPDDDGEWEECDDDDEDCEEYDDEDEE